MKIAIIKNEVSFTKGGAERYAANLCRSLATMGHQVWVVAEKFDPALHPALIHVPVKVSHTTSAARNLSFHENSQKALAGISPDAVLALSRSFPADAFRVSDPLHRFWMKVRYPGKLNHFLQSINPRHRAILALEKGILDPANTRSIITNSRLSKDIIGRYYDYPADRIHVIHNGVDLEKFRPAPSEARTGRGDIRLLFVGQDFRRKGLSAVIDALVLLQKDGPPCRLRVIGRDDPAPYRRQAESLGLAPLVTFEGPSRDIHLAYQAEDLFVFPTHYDPFANVCLEAMACGLPVLTTTTNGASEVITEGLHGYVISGEPAPSPADIAAKIEAFRALPPARRDEMRAAAAEKALHFTPEANARQVAGLLSRVTSP